MALLGVIAILASAVLLTLILYLMAPHGVTRTITLAEKLRGVGGILFLALMAWHLSTSGNPVYIALAALGAAFLTGHLIVERPWEETI